MKKFKYAHSPLTYILLAVVMIATAIGCFFSISSAITQVETIKTVAYIVLSAVNLFLFVAVFLALICSRYTVNDKFIKLSFGLFYAKYQIESVTTITNLIDVKKLVVCLCDGRFFFAVISEKDFSDFTKAIKDKNPEVVFDVGYVSPTKKG